MKSIIWNMTRQCAWNCKFCCVAAKYVGHFNRDKIGFKLQDDELSFEDKIKIIDQLKRGDYRIDFSGGDLLIDPSNLEVVLYASEKLGSENVGMSVSGAFLDDATIERIAGKVHDVELTLDRIPFEYDINRPVGYHEYNANAAVRLRKAGVRVGIQTVLTKSNIDKESIDKLFDWLVKNDMNEWSLIRFFQSGRGANFENLEPSHKEYCDVVDYIKEISEGKNVEVHFQYLLPNHDGYTLDCRAVRKSIGILPDGTVTSCFWGLDSDMKPKDEKYLLGKLPKENIYDVLSNEKSKYWCDGCHSCEIFTFGRLENKDSDNNDIENLPKAN